MKIGSFGVRPTGGAGVRKPLAICSPGKSDYGLACPHGLLRLMAQVIHDQSMGNDPPAANPAGRIGFGPKNEARPATPVGFAEVIARDLGQQVECAWWPQQRGSPREGLNAGLCDLILGTPKLDPLLATRPVTGRPIFSYSGEKAGWTWVR